MKQVGVIFLFVLIIGACILVTTFLKRQNEPVFSADKTLVQLRKEHKTNLVSKGPASEDYEQVSVSLFKRVLYKTNGHENMAQLHVPKVKGKRPALLFLHGGNSLSNDDTKIVMPFLNAGFIVMLPTMRGENGNAGFYEMCYGEVDDAANALDYLANHERVNKDMLFVAGHSIGGTTAMLLAESTNKLKKAAACGGYPDMRLSGPYPDCPCEQTREELDLRSPARHLKDLGCPLMLYYGDDGADRHYYQQARKMRLAAVKVDKYVDVKQISGVDHFNAIEKSIPMMINYFSSN